MGGEYPEERDCKEEVDQASEGLVSAARGSKLMGFLLPMVGVMSSPNVHDAIPTAPVSDLDRLCRMGYDLFFQVVYVMGPCMIQVLCSLRIDSGSKISV
jgi:hypothetical protein